MRTITELIDHFSRESAVAASAEIEWPDTGKAYPPLEIFPANETKAFVVTTKPDAFVRAFTLDDGALVGRYGLLEDRYATLLSRVVGDHPAYFLGDLDPLDLTVFSFLRSCVRSIQFIGINSEWINVVGTRVSGMKISLSDFERQNRDELLRVVPDLGAVVGSQALAMLEADTKIELDGFFGLAARDTKIAQELASIMSAASGIAVHPQK